MTNWGRFDGTWTGSHQINLDGSARLRAAALNLRERDQICGAFGQIRGGFDLQLTHLRGCSSEEWCDRDACEALQLHACAPERLYMNVRCRLQMPRPSNVGRSSANMSRNQCEQLRITLATRVHRPMSSFASIVRDLIQATQGVLTMSRVSSSSFCFDNRPDPAQRTCRSRVARSPLAQRSCACGRSAHALQGLAEFGQTQPHVCQVWPNSASNIGPKFADTKPP